MVFSRFIWTVVANVAAIVGTSVLLGLYIHKPGYPVTLSILALLLVLETMFLIQTLLRIRRDLQRLILALRNEDPTLQFSKEGRDPYFSAIHRDFNEIIRNFRLVRLDREVEHHFFEATVEHIRFGIIAFDREGRVELANRSLLELFRLKKIEHIDALEEVSPGLPDWLRQLSQDTETLRRVTLDGQPFHLIFLTSRFKLMNREITLVSVRDISREIDRNELEAWQKLMRILRHEILNSISPIKLLSSNLSGILQREEENVSLASLKEEEIREMRTGLETIHRRATGLSNFLDAYSNLYRVPELELKPTRVYGLLQRIIGLYRDQFGTEQIAARVECNDPDLEIVMDERMIEQVLINLVKNALEALGGTMDPELVLSAWESGMEAIVAVKDNGAGIPEDQLEHIFIPFYSSRKQGTGVGLSFSQHVMRLHQGRIHVRSLPGKGSEFQLVFQTKGR
jgi:two-component system nitrogen regulation sensor histidine kinase NtrY